MRGWRIQTKAFFKTSFIGSPLLLYSVSSIFFQSLTAGLNFTLLTQKAVYIELTTHGMRQMKQIEEEACDV